MVSPPAIPRGFKGAGEAGAAGAPAAILNVVNNALVPLGVVALTDQPLTAEPVWRALQSPFAASVKNSVV